MTTRVPKSEYKRLLMVTLVPKFEPIRGLVVPEGVNGENGTKVCIKRYFNRRIGAKF